MLGEEPDVKEQLFEVLKQYAAERDVEALAEALPDILISEEHQQLIDSVRYTTTTTSSSRQGALQSPPCLGWKSFVIYIYMREFLKLFSLHLVWASVAASDATRPPH